MIRRITTIFHHQKGITTKSYFLLILRSRLSLLICVLAHFVSFSDASFTSTFVATTQFGTSIPSSGISRRDQQFSWTTCTLKDSSDSSENDIATSKVASPPTVPQTKTDEEESSACPFSRTFPRFRIRLTSSSSSSSSSKEEASNDNPFFSFFGKSQSDNNKSQQRKRVTVEKANRGRPIRWFPNQENGIQAFASIWRAVVDFEEQQEYDHSDIHDKEYMVLGFPDTDPEVLHNFCEIFNWAVEQGVLDTGSDNNGSAPSTMEAEFQLEGPAICLSREGRQGKSSSSPPPPSTQQAQQQHQEKNDDYAAIVNRRTRAWVDRVLVNMGICPFTKSSKTSGQGLGELGVPVGRIAYHASFMNSTGSSDATSTQRPYNVARLMADTWEAIYDMIQAGPRYQEGGISSILLTAPDFDDHFGIFAGPVFAMLETSVVAARAEQHIGVVCFHPKYATPDGTSWPGFGHMHSVPRLQKWIVQQREEAKEAQERREREKRRRALYNLVDPTSASSDDPPRIESESDSPSPIMDERNVDELTDYCRVAAGGAWQRRTPHATINVLRADQLEIAEKKRNSAHLYPKNIAKLMSIGNDQLQEDLNRERDLQ